MFSEIVVREVHDIGTCDKLCAQMLAVSHFIKSCMTNCIGKDTDGLHDVNYVILSGTDASFETFCTSNCAYCLTPLKVIWKYGYQCQCRPQAGCNVKHSAYKFCLPLGHMTNWTLQKDELIAVSRLPRKQWMAARPSSSWPTKEILNQCFPTEEERALWKKGLSWNCSAVLSRTIKAAEVLCSTSRHVLLAWLLSSLIKSFPVRPNNKRLRLCQFLKRCFKVWRCYFLRWSIYLSLQTMLLSEPSVTYRCAFSLSNATLCNHVFATFRDSKW